MCSTFDTKCTYFGNAITTTICNYFELVEIKKLIIETENNRFRLFILFTPCFIPHFRL